MCTRNLTYKASVNIVVPKVRFKQASGLASRKSNWVAVKHSIIQFKSGCTKKLF